MLKEAEDYKVPSNKHEGIANFMVQQLRTTLESNSDDYYVEARQATKEELAKKISAKEYREKLLTDKKEELERALARYNQSVADCEQSNKWAALFLESIKGR